MHNRVLIIAGIFAVIVISLVVITISKNHNVSDNFFQYDVEYNNLSTRNTFVSVHIAVEPFTDKVCYDITDDEFENFPSNLQELMISTREEIVPPEQISQYDKERFFFEDVGYFDGNGGAIPSRDALEFLKKYDSFKLTEKFTNQNIRHLDDESYSFECDVIYNNHQYRLSFSFEPLYPSWENFVVLNVTKNPFGTPIILNSDAVVYTSFNATVLFANNLDHDITLSRQEGMIQDRGGSFDEIVIPAGQSWPYTLRTWNLNDENMEPEFFLGVPFNFEIQPGNLFGKVTVKNYPRCMTETEVTSLYAQVNAHPKFPTYLPDDYYFECGIHNMNAYVHMKYWNDSLREKYGEFPEGSFQFEFFSDGGISIDYYNEYVLNGWSEEFDYDKYEKAKENEEHPRAISMIILDQPAVMIEDAARVHGKIQSFNKLQIFLDNGVHYQIRSGLPQEEIIKISESIIEQELN